MKYKLVACIVCIIVEQSMLLMKDKVQRKWSLKVITTSSVILLTLKLYILTYAKSGRWQAPAAVLPEGPKDQGESHSRARRAREWLKPASPRARRARGRAKPSACFGACQCYYMFFTIQPKIAIFVAQFKYLNDGQYD